MTDIKLLDEEKLKEFKELLEKAVENLEKHPTLTNEQIKGLFKTFLTIQIQNTEFVSEVLAGVKEIAEDVKKLKSNNSTQKE